MAVRSAQESTHLNPDNVASDESVDNLLQRINESVNSAIDDLTLLDMVENSDAETDSKITGLPISSQP